MDLRWAENVAGRGNKGIYRFLVGKHFLAISVRSYLKVSCHVSCLMFSDTFLFFIGLFNKGLPTEQIYGRVNNEKYETGL